LETIRRIKDQDFEQVSALYNGRKTVQELKWLYSDPEDPGNYNAFVAVDKNNKIIGEIAYSLSVYVYDDQKIKGVIPFNWKIEEGYKGMAGILLFKKVLSLTKFSFAIGGTDEALSLFPLFKMKETLRIHQFYKILDLCKFSKSFKRRSKKKTLGMIGYLLPSFFYKTNKDIYPDLEFVRYTGLNFAKEQNTNNVFRKEITKNYIDWLLACPVVQSYAFTIKKGNIDYGICVLYIKKVKKYNRGRIVHLPFLGDDQRLWSSVLTKCIDFFKKEECSFITAQSFHQTVTAGYLNTGFMKIDRHSHPLFVKENNKDLKTINFKNWHIQYSEGDKVYRGF
jgi:hypothetical protein